MIIRKNSDLKNVFYVISSILIINLILMRILNNNAPSQIPSMDGVFFLKIANNILNFGELGWQGYFEPFFYPLVTAFFSFLSDELLYAGMLVSEVAKLFLVVTVYFLAKAVYDRKVALASALLVTFMPHINVISRSPQSESLYSLLITLALFCAWLTYKRASYLMAVIAGIVFASAYLTRSEGIFILLFVLTAMIFLLIRKKTLNKKSVISLFLLMAVFMTSSMPYFIYLKNHYGSWTVGTKTASVYFWIRSKSFNDPDPERGEWGLSPQGELNLISLTSKDYVHYWFKDPAKSLKVYLKNLKAEIPGFVPNTSGIAHYPQVYPLYLFFPMLIGLIIKLMRRNNMEGDIILLSVFLMMLIYPFFTSGWWRYLVTYSPVLMILAANGLYEINKEISIRFRGVIQFKKLTSKEPLIWIFVVAISLYHLWVMTGKELQGSKKTYVQRKHAFALETKKAGEWARKNLPAGANYMSEWSRLVYYLDGRWTGKPHTDYNQMIRYARKYNVDYIVYEVNNKRVYQRYKSMNTKEMEYAGSYESDQLPYYVIFFRLKK